MIRVENQKYRNWALGDLFYSEKKHEEQMAKYDVLQQIANKPATGSTLIYLIPIIGLVIFGVIFAVIVKRKKKE